MRSTFSENILRVILIVLLLTVFADIRLSAQETQLIESHGGAHLPTHGEVRGLILFIEMRGDDTPDVHWKLGALPDWAQSYADRLTENFLDMSGGDLEIKLDIYPDPILTRSTEDNYVYWNQRYGDAIKEIIDSIDVNMDFAPYDNWYSGGRAYRLEPGGEGKVDLIIAVFRSIANPNFLPFSGISDLGFGGYKFVDGSLDRWVYGGSGQYNDAGSSGITLCKRPGSKEVVSEEYAFQVSLHEIGHKLFGEGHPAELYGGLGLMANAGNGVAMNSFERRLAGYIDYRQLTPGRDTVFTLTDYLTRNDAVLLPIPEHDRSYYSFEFHSKDSKWDSAPTAGLYIFRLYDSWSKNQKQVLLISAEGSFQWQVDSTTNMVEQVRSDPISGYNRFQRIPIDGTNYWAYGWWGDERSAFTMRHPEFSVLKNPSPDYLLGPDTIHTNLHISLLDMTDSTATVRVSYQSPVILNTNYAADVDFNLDPSYPNPVLKGGTAYITFTLEYATDVLLELFDVSGKRIGVLDRGKKSAGTHSAAIQTSSLQPGAYFVRLRSADRVLHRKFVISR